MAPGSGSKDDETPRRNGKDHRRVRISLLNYLAGGSLTNLKPRPAPPAPPPPAASAASTPTSRSDGASHGRTGGVRIIEEVHVTSRRDASGRGRRKMPTLELVREGRRRTVDRADAPGGSRRDVERVGVNGGGVDVQIVDRGYGGGGGDGQMVDNDEGDTTVYVRRAGDIGETQVPTPEGPPNVVEAKSVAKDKPASPAADTNPEKPASTPAAETQASTQTPKTKPASKANADAGGTYERTAETSTPSKSNADDKSVAGPAGVDTSTRDDGKKDPAAQKKGMQADKQTEQVPAAKKNGNGKDGGNSGGGGGRTWTAEQDAKVLDMQARQCPLKDIASALGISKKEIQQRIRVLGKESGKNGAAKTSDKDESAAATESGTAHDASSKGDSQGKETQQPSVVEMSGARADEDAGDGAMAVTPGAWSDDLVTDQVKDNTTDWQATVEEKDHGNDPFADMFAGPIDSGETGVAGDDAAWTWTDPWTQDTPFNEQQQQQEQQQEQEQLQNGQDATQTVTAWQAGHVGEVLWTAEDAGILETLVQRYEENKWLQLQAAFFNWTGRMLSGDVIREKAAGPGRNDKS